MRLPSAWLKRHGYLTTVVALALVCGISFLLRVYYPFDSVFVDDWVRFQSTDPWYHMRHIENLVHNFPHATGFDPYAFYPSGTAVGTAPLFGFQIALFAWVFGAGSPSKEIVEAVGAFFPAVVGALIPIPVYFMGRELGGRGVGFIAAALIAILPGQFLVRTLLGYTDHHAAEILYSTLTMLFLILALRESARKNISFGSVRAKDWPALRRPLLYSLLTGISLALYLLSWASGAFLVFIILAFVLLQYIVDHLRNRPTDYLCLIGLPAFLVALLIIIPFAGSYRLGDMQQLSLAAGILATLGLSGISCFMTRRGWSRAYFVLAIAVLVGIGVALVYVADPELFDSVLERMGVAFNPGGTRLTIAEVGGLSASLAWEYFGPAFYMSLISLAVVLYVVIREGAPVLTLLLVWTLIALVATFGQQRFACYLAVNVALLTAYLCWTLFKYAWLRVPGQARASEGAVGVTASGERESSSKTTRKARRKLRKQARKGIQDSARPQLVSPRTLLCVVSLVLVFLVVFYPNIQKAVVWANTPRGPHQDWHEALVWMEGNTPEPFSDPALFYETYDVPAEDQSGSNPSAAYGVMSWWDYGYWITYIAHRVPNANPGQRGIGNAARFLVAQDESSAMRVLDRAGSKYIVIDLKTAIPTIEGESAVQSSFPSIAEWAGKDSSEFFEVYYSWQGGKLLRMLCYYPAFYQSMCTRLYVFEGKAVTPQDSSWIISFAEKTDSEGVEYKEILHAQQFATYEEAQEYMDQHPASNQRIVSNSPFNSPVPLEGLEHFRLAYKSSTRATKPGVRDVSWVEVFEYLP